MRKSRAVAGLALAALLHLSCATSWRARLFAPAATPPRSVDAPFLKVHLKDGAVLVLDRWDVDGAARRIAGDGIRYGADRAKEGQGALAAAFDEIALVETNRPERVARTGLAVLGVVAGASLALTAACLANPKACFGSCPTFYVPGAEAGGPVAEGFSSSVARAFEATDVDAIDVPRPLGRTLELEMRDEALETHLVRFVRLLVAPRPPGGRVYRAGGAFLSSPREVAPVACAGAEGDCLAAVSRADGVEYASAAGARDLAEQETIEARFPRVAAPAGLVVRARNTLLNTFVFYQGLAWLGGRAGDVFARLERDPSSAPAFTGWARLLGEVEVWVLGARGWVRAGAVGEVGPLARDTEVVPLPRDLPPGDVRVQLRLTRGNWRIDALALAELGAPVVPARVELAEVLRDGAPDAAARARLLDPAAYLVASPGDAYRLRWELPAGTGDDVELFLESRGYYLEWIREQWLPEEDLDAAARLVLDPRETLRRLAPAYKRIEPDIERMFWASRVRGRP